MELGGLVPRGTLLVVLAGAALLVRAVVVAHGCRKELFRLLFRATGQGGRRIVPGSMRAGARRMDSMDTRLV